MFLEFLKIFGMLILYGIGFSFFVFLLFGVPFWMRKHIVKKNPGHKIVGWIAQIGLTSILFGSFLYIDSRIQVFGVYKYFSHMTVFKTIGVILIAIYIIGVFENK